MVVYIYPKTTDGDYRIKTSAKDVILGHIGILSSLIFLKQKQTLVQAFVSIEGCAISVLYRALIGPIWAVVRHLR